MKRLLALLLTSAVTLLAVGCGGTSSGGGPEPEVRQAKEQEKADIIKQALAKHRR
jgi:hypothetical protein